MFASYIIEPISLRTIDLAYPLARATGRTLTLGEWRDICQPPESPDGRQASREREQTVVAINARGYVKGLCIYSIRDHSSYGRLLDIPFFVVASAADAEGVTVDLLNFLRSECNVMACSGIRFWTMGAQTWSRRDNAEDFERTDHGLFMPASASVSDVEKALCAHAMRQAIDQFLR